MNGDLESSPEQASGFDSTAILNLEVYTELRRLAGRQMSQQLNPGTFQPTMLVHEAWLRMSAKSNKWKDRNHFLATAVMTMRHILIDNARRKASLRHGKGLIRTETGGMSALPAPTPDDDILLIDEGIRELEKTQPLKAQIVIARFFGGLSNAEIADCLDIGERSVERHWASAKIWLYRWMQKSKRL